MPDPTFPSPPSPVPCRSHCIFTIEIEARRGDSDIVRRSKLRLVDLAGSERVSKTNADGKGLQEAKYINKSLHFLEQVMTREEGRRGEGKGGNKRARVRLCKYAECWCRALSQR